jgi:hypothetical protein
MHYIGTPVEIKNRDGLRTISRTLQDEVARLDNLVELVVFTPRGSFTSDPDFGFEYWNHEYANVHFREFNNGQGSVVTEVTRQTCEDSVRESILAYEPGLKQIDVAMELKSLSAEEQRKRKTLSRYEVVVRVDGLLDNGLGTTRVYSKRVSFLMEPTAKKMTI